MKLGIFLNAGDSFSNMARSGQGIRFKKFYIENFAKRFDKVYIFSYADEKVDFLPKNVILIPNKYKLHRYLYGFLMPFLNRSYIKKCNIFRIYHLSGVIPGIITRAFFNLPYVFNYAYDYEKFAELEDKKIQKFFFMVTKPLALITANKILVANKKIMSHFVGSKFVYLPNGVDTNFFKPFPDQYNKKPIVLFVGRLEKQKNLENLIKALEGIDVKLLLVGSGSLKQRLLKLARDIGVDLEIIDKVENIEMPRIYNLADIFILPSFIEGHPKVLLEAMACGIPCVGSEVEGITDVIIDKENGLLTNKSSQDISENIKLLLADTKLRSFLGRQGRKTIEQKFDLNLLLNKELEEMLNIYA
jgi:glycosyltransferase involved in cell wall biosynthesis